MKKWFKILLLVLGGILFFLSIDLVCIFTIHRPIFAIKKEEEKVYLGILYDTYYCDEFSLPQIKGKDTKFSCALNRDNESVFKVTEVRDVSMRISNIRPCGAILIIRDMNQEPYIYGEWYKIEKEVDGKWCELEPFLDNYGFNDIGYLVDQNNEVTFTIDWEWLYGKLPKGNYRILKEVNHQYISTEFSLVTT